MERLATENIKINYNTFINQIEVPIPMEEVIVDSFRIVSHVDDSLLTNLTFISSKVLGAEDIGFYLRINDWQFTLYKKYNSTLGIATSNYIESDLRQFELNYDDYYLNKKAGKIKKIKFSYNGIKKSLDQLRIIHQFSITVSPMIIGIKLYMRYLYF